MSHEVREVLAACLIQGWIEDRCLSIGALHDLRMQQGRHNTADPVCEGAGAVHEDPESRQRNWTLQNTTKDNTHECKHDDNTRCCYGIRKRGYRHGREGRGVDEKLDAVQEYKNLAF